MESRNHDKCRGWVGFSVKMAHRITAGEQRLAGRVASAEGRACLFVVIAHRIAASVH